MARRPGAALNREAGGLVDDDHVIIAMEDEALQKPFIGRARRDDLGLGSRHRRRQGRHADALSRGDAVARIGAFAVKPDLARAQQLFEPAMAEFGEMPLEPAVETDFGVLGRHGQGLDATHAPHPSGAGGHDPSRALGITQRRQWPPCQT
jgi:hypothetical protein